MSPPVDSEGVHTPDGKCTLIKGATDQKIIFIVTKYPVHKSNILYSRLNYVLYKQVTIKDGMMHTVMQ